MSDKKRLSFEFFPPRTDAGKEKLVTVRQDLSRFSPDFYSVTYGAGGSTRDNTKSIVLESITAGFSAAPHLSFGGDDEQSVGQLLSEYKDAGVNRIVALRGDLPSGSGGGARLVHANELVEFIRQRFGDHFQLEVAAYPEIHPEASSYSDDIKYLKQKFDCGANSAITQYFFNLDAYKYFLDECDKQGISNPIYPGIMPIINFANLKRFSANCGAEIPRWLCHKVESYGGDSVAAKQFCDDYVLSLCERLLEIGVPGLHFYTMNQIDPTSRLCEKLGF